MQKKIAFWVSFSLFLFTTVCSFLVAEATYPLFLYAKNATGIRLFFLDVLLVPDFLLLLAVVISNLSEMRLSYRTIGLCTLSAFAVALGKAAYYILDFTVAPYVFSSLVLLFAPFAIASAFADLFHFRFCRLKKVLFAIFSVVLGILCAGLIFFGSVSIKSAYLIFLSPVFLPLAALPYFFEREWSGFGFSFVCGLIVSFILILRAFSVSLFNIFAWLLPIFAVAVLAKKVFVYIRKKSGRMMKQEKN